MARHVQPAGHLFMTILQPLYPASWLGSQHDDIVSWCCSWKGRINSVRQARQAYAKAVHVKPDRAAAWGDAASAFYVEAQLRRAHTSMQLEEGCALTQASERCIRGAVAALPDALILLLQASCNFVHTLPQAVFVLKGTRRIARNWPFHSALMYLLRD